jgi:hypothetical protein
MSVGSVSALMGNGLAPALAAQLGETYLDTITAATTQTQGAGTALTATVNIITVCANGGDACTLPSLATYGSAMIVVANLGAQNCNLFPAVGQAIQAIAANSAFTLTAGKTAVLWGRTFTSTGKWLVFLSA